LWNADSYDFIWSAGFPSDLLACADARNADTVRCWEGFWGDSWRVDVLLKKRGSCVADGFAAVWREDLMFFYF